MALISGDQGQFKVGSPGTETTIGYLTAVEIEVDTEIKTHGPFVGNPNREKVRAGKDASGTASGVMTNPRDPGQNLLRQAYMNDTDVRLVLEIGPIGSPTDVVTIPAAIINSISFGPQADEGVTIEFSFESNGAFTWT